MQLYPNLFFAGDAEAALSLYRDALGGDVQIVRFAGTPAGAHIPSEWESKVLYGALASPFGVINAMDAPPGREGAPGDNFAIEIRLEDETQAAEIFSRLCAGGNVTMPFEETFFAKKFGMGADRFGVKWMVNVPSVVPVG